MLLQALTKMYNKKVNYIDVTRTTDTFVNVKFHALIDEDDSIFGVISSNQEIDDVIKIVENYLDQALSNYKITKSQSPNFRWLAQELNKKTESERNRLMM